MLLPPLDGNLVPPLSEHDPGFDVQYRNHPVVEVVWGFEVPLKVAVVAKTLDAGRETVAGVAGSVANVEYELLMILPVEVLAIAHQ